MGSQETDTRDSLLIAGGEPEGLRLLAAILETEGYLVRTLPAGSMVLPIVLKGPPALILLDLSTPDMDPYKVCARLKAHKIARDIPVIFIGAKDELRDRVRGFESGAVDYIAKPLCRQEVLARVGTHISLHKMQRNLEEQNRQLKFQEAMYRRLVENQPGITYLFSYTNGTTYISGKVEEILGYSPSYMLDHPFIWRELIHPDDLERVDRLTGEFKTGRDYSIEYRIRDRKGQWHWFNDRSIGRNIDADEIVMEGIAMDITERKRADESHRADHHKYMQLVENLAAPSLLFSRLPDGVITYVSPPINDIMGLTPEDAKGRPCRRS